MRKEIENWWKQAKHDLEAASKNLKIGEYYLVAFLSQQAVEKGLKAVVMLKHRQRIVTHSLAELGKKVGIGTALLKDLRVISPEYVISRYPNATESVPYENYDEEIAKDRLRRAKRVFKWLNTQMKE